jgi:hypothetical protein
MSEVNAFMNGYQPNNDVAYLKASLDAHKVELKKSEEEVEVLKKFIIDVRDDLPPDLQMIAYELIED